MPADVIEPDVVPSVRRAQELATLEPILRDVAVALGEIRDAFHIRHFSTLLLSITPYVPTPLAAPQWLGGPAGRSRRNPALDPKQRAVVYSYELLRLGKEVMPAAPTPCGQRYRSIGRRLVCIITSFRLLAPWVSEALPSQARPFLSRHSLVHYRTALSMTRRRRPVGNPELWRTSRCSVGPPGSGTFQ